MESLDSLLGKLGREGSVDIDSIRPNVNETEEEKRARAKAYEESLCESFNKAKGDLNEKDGYDCKACNNKGGVMILTERGGMFYQTYRPCKCMKVRSMIVKLEKSGLKNVIKDYSFENYKCTEDWQKTLRDTAERFSKDSEHTWFFIGGMSGVGKTHLCTAIAASYLRQNKVVKYMLWRDEITRLKANVTDTEKYNNDINALKEAEVLYIDDLFKMGKDSNGNVQRPTVSDVNIAFEVINYRYNNKKLITIISSERTLQDLISIDEALGGRISEMTVPYGYYLGIKHDPAKNYRTKGLIEL